MKRHRTVVLASVLRIANLVATTLVAFLLMPFLVRHLGDRLYGYWALAGAVLGYFGVMDLGIISAVEYHVAKSLGEREIKSSNQAISTSVFAFAGIGVLILLLTALVAFLVPSFVRDPSDATAFRTVLLIMGLSCALGFPGRAFLGAVSAHLRWDLIASVYLIVLAARTTLVVLVIKSGRGIVGLAVTSLICELLTYAALYLILRSIHNSLEISPALVSWRKLKEILGYGGSAFIVKVSDQIRFYTDGWMVSFVVGISAVTHYAIASRLSLSMLDLIIAVVGIISPWFSFLLGNQDFSGIRRVFTLSTKISASLSTIVAASLILYGRAFVGVWMGPRYLDFYWPLVALALAVFLNASQMPSISYLYGVSRHKFLAQITAIEAAANFALSFYWGRKWGMVGVALGTLAPMFVMKVLFQPAYTCRQVGISLRSYALNLMGRTVLACTLSVVVPWALVFRYLLPGNLPGVCAVIALEAVTATVVAFFLVFSQEERGLFMAKMFSRSQSRVQPTAMESVDAGL